MGCPTRSEQLGAGSAVTEDPKYPRPVEVAYLGRVQWTLPPFAGAGPAKTHGTSD